MCVCAAVAPQQAAASCVGAPVQQADCAKLTLTAADSTTAVVCLSQIHDGTNTPLNQFLKDPDSLITRVTWKDEQDKV